MRETDSVKSEREREGQTDGRRHKTERGADRQIDRHRERVSEEGERHRESDRENRADVARVNSGRLRRQLRMKNMTMGYTGKNVFKWQQCHLTRRSNLLLASRPL